MDKLYTTGKIFSILGGFSLLTYYIISKKSLKSLFCDDYSPGVPHPQKVEELNKKSELNVGPKFVEKVKITDNSEFTDNQPTAMSYK